MDTIDDFIDRLLARYQQTPEVQEAKVQMSEIMHQAYIAYQHQGLAVDDAMFEVLNQFRHLGTTARVLKIDTAIFIPVQPDSDESADRAEGDDNHYPELTMEEAEAFIAVKRRTQRLLAGGIALLLLWPVVLLQTAAGGLIPLSFNGSNDHVVGVVLALAVAGAGALMLYRRHYELAQFPRILNGEFSPNRDVTVWIRKFQSERDNRESIALIVSIGLWLTALVPILLGIIARDSSAIFGLSRLGLSISFVMVAVGFFVNLSGAWASSAAKYLTGEKFGVEREF